jgi:metallo-beta-lactamase class B
VILRYLCVCLALLILTSCAKKTKPEVVVNPHPCAEKSGWDDASPPYQVHGNTWYVGTCGITSILITSEEGHVLIDGGTEQGASLIKANVEKLGFQLSDIQYILISHEHHDHVGGVSELQRLTGATVLARGVAAEVLRSGKTDRRDPQFLEHKPFPAVQNVEEITGSEPVDIGGTMITPHASPGHTPGGTSWTWQSCAEVDCKNIAYIDSLTALSDSEYRYTDESKAPGMLAAFRGTIGMVRALPCDVLISTHPSASNLWARLGPGANVPLSDNQSCVKYADKAYENLEARISKEQQALITP